MKVLFTVPPAFAHINPVVPLAGALQGAGHEVRLATHPEMTDVARAAGLTAVGVGERDFPKASARLENDELHDRISAAIAADIAAGDPERGERMPAKPVIRALQRYYNPAPVGAEGSSLMVDDLVEFARGWRPDLIIWDFVSFPAAIAARECGAAHARIILSVDDIAWARKKILQRLRVPGSGLDTDPMAAYMRPMLDRFGQQFAEELILGQWTIDHSPAIRMRMPHDHLRYVYTRQVPFNGSAVVPNWLHAPRERPRVALSLGAGIRSFQPAGPSKVLVEEFFDMAVDLDIELVATLDERQLRSVGTIPEQVRVMDYLPLNLLLPTCAAIIHHGGGGTLSAAVPHRVPQLIWPERSQYYHDFARYVERGGAGLIIDDDPFDAEVVKKQLVQVLNEPSFKEGAEDLYRDTLAVPPPTDIVASLEQLTARHREAA